MQDKNILIEGCERKDISGVQPKDLFLCYTTTTSSGEFTFPVVPFGNYFVAPYYKEEHIYYQPDKIEFSIHHTSVQLNENFQVIGFTVPGKVTNGKNDAIANAKIFLNGNEITRTDKLGKYKLEKLKVGAYRLRAEAGNYIVNNAIFKATIISFQIIWYLMKSLLISTQIWDLYPTLFHQHSKFVVKLSVINLKMYYLNTRHHLN